MGCTSIISEAVGDNRFFSIGQEAAGGRVIGEKEEG